jgi:hypothetical protein
VQNKNDWVSVANVYVRHDEKSILHSYEQKSAAPILIQYHAGVVKIGISGARREYKLESSMKPVAIVLNE